MALPSIEHGRLVLVIDLVETNATQLRRAIGILLAMLEETSQHEAAAEQRLRDHENAARKILDAARNILDKEATE